MLSVGLALFSPCWRRRCSPRRSDICSRRPRRASGYDIRPDRVPLSAAAALRHGAAVRRRARRFRRHPAAGAAQSAGVADDARHRCRCAAGAGAGDAVRAGALRFRPRCRRASPAARRLHAHRLRPRPRKDFSAVSLCSPGWWSASIAARSRRSSCMLKDRYLVSLFIWGAGSLASRAGSRRSTSRCGSRPRVRGVRFWCGRCRCSTSATKAAAAWASSGRIGCGSWRSRCPCCWRRFVDQRRRRDRLHRTGRADPGAPCRRPAASASGSSGRGDRRAASGADRHRGPACRRRHGGVPADRRGDRRLRLAAAALSPAAAEGPRAAGAAGERPALPRRPSGKAITALAPVRRRAFLPLPPPRAGCRRRLADPAACRMVGCLALAGAAACGRLSRRRHARRRRPHPSAADRQRDGEPGGPGRQRRRRLRLRAVALSPRRRNRPRRRGGADHRRRHGGARRDPPPCPALGLLAGDDAAGRHRPQCAARRGDRGPVGERRSARLHPRRLDGRLDPRHDARPRPAHRARRARFSSRQAVSPRAGWRSCRSARPSRCRSACRSAAPGWRCFSSRPR